MLLLNAENDAYLCRLLALSDYVERGLANYLFEQHRPLLQFTMYYLTFLETIESTWIT